MIPRPFLFKFPDQERDGCPRRLILKCDHFFPGIRLITKHGPSARQFLDSQAEPKPTLAQTGCRR
jgi:hypothetical protein